MLEARHLRSEPSGARTLCAGACLRLGIAEQIMVNRKLLKRLEDLEDRILPATEEPERMVIKFVEMDGSYSGESIEYFIPTCVPPITPGRRNPSRSELSARRKKQLDGRVSNGAST